MEAARQSPVRPWLQTEVRQGESAAGVTLVRRSVAAAPLSAERRVTWFQENVISVRNAAVSLFAVVTRSFILKEVKNQPLRARLNMSHPLASGRLRAQMRRLWR